MSDKFTSCITLREALDLVALYNRQGAASGGLPIDRLPYTKNIRWLAEKMNNKFDARNWTEQLVYAVLAALQEGGLIGDLAFPPDDPLDGVNLNPHFHDEEVEATRTGEAG